MVDHDVQDHTKGSEQEPSQDLDTPEQPPAELMPLLGGVSWDDYLTCDNEVATSIIQDNDWEDKIVAKARGTEAEEDDQDEEEEAPPKPKVTYQQAFDSLKILMDSALQHHDSDMFQSLSRAHNWVVDHSISRRTCLTQKKMDDFSM